jgi:hypothetical protein
VAAAVAAYEAYRANEINQNDQGEGDEGAWMDLLVQLQAACGQPAQGISLATLCDWGQLRLGPSPNQFIIYTSNNLCDPNTTYQVILVADHRHISYDFGGNTGFIRASKFKDTVLDALKSVNAACEVGAVNPT